MKTNIPICRGKKIDSDEYVEGTIDPYGNYILQEACGNKTIGNKEHFVYFSIEIDPSTLAIHFPDMLDSEGTKIFASLSEDGKGGDIDESYSVFIFDSLYGTYGEWHDQSDFKVTGIQQ